jgi:hypothetical protein
LGAFRRQNSEDRRQKTEDRRQKTEDRRQKTEDRIQKTEVRIQETGDRRQNTEVRIAAVPLTPSPLCPVFGCTGSTLLRGHKRLGERG